MQSNETTLLIAHLKRSLRGY